MSLFRIISRIIVSSLVLQMFLFPVRSIAQDGGRCYWPQFHGPNRDNMSTETGLLKTWSEKGPELLWTAKDLGYGYATVSIADGMIYTAGNKEDKTLITAMDMNGNHLWQVQNGKAWKRSYPGTRGTPTIEGGFLYHENPLGNIVCLKAKTGEKAWERNVVKDYKSELPTWALAESLLIEGDHVICSPGGPVCCMAALDKTTGKTVWKTKSIGEKAGYASPVAVSANGLRIIVTLTAKSMIGVNAATGKLLWSERHESYADENVMTPIYHDGCIFVSTLKTGSIKWRLSVKEEKAEVEKLWHSKELDNHHGDVVLVDGCLYGASCIYNRSRWVCLDWKTGEMKYAEKGVGKGSLTCAEGMLYTLSNNRKVGLVRARPDKHELSGYFEIPKGAKGPTWAHPVVCGGRLYIRHGELLYCYSIKAGNGTDLNDAEQAALIRKQIPEATGMTLDETKKLFSSPTRPALDSMDNVPLSYVLLAIDPLQGAEHEKEFRYLTEGRPPKPSVLAGVLTKGGVRIGDVEIIRPAYYTFLRANAITEVTARVEKNRASGTVSFTVPKLFAGCVSYKAKRLDKAWEIEEFSFPARKLVIRKSAEGKWGATQN